MEHVKNKVVLITGASSGIGEATARLLATHGAKVVLGARRVERLQNIVADIEAAGGEAAAFAVDVTNAENVKAFVAFAQKRYGAVDVIFNNAGVMPLSPMNALKTDEWNAIIDTNIKGVLNGIAAALPLMEGQGFGHIINTASVGGHVVVGSCGVYCASKFAVRAISEGLRQETNKVRVTIISPGVTETELGHDITDAASAEILVALRKDAMDASAIANAVLYAVSQPAQIDVNEVIIRPVSSYGQVL